MNLTAFMEYFDKGLNFLLRPVVIVLSLLIAGMLSWGIFARVVIGVPLFGLEELVLICVMWLYMIGTIFASKDRSHLTADFVQIIFRNKRILSFIRFLATVISLVIALNFVTWSYDLFIWGFEKKQTTPVFRIPWYVSQSSVLFCSVFLTLYLVRDTFNDLKDLLRKNEDQDEGDFL